MKARDLTDLALRNLREAIFRNVLTTLGVAVGVGVTVIVAYRYFLGCSGGGGRSPW